MREKTFRRLRIVAPFLIPLATFLWLCDGSNEAVPPASEGALVEKPFFSFVLPEGWNEEPSGDPDRWLFIRKDDVAMLTISGMSDPQARSGAMLEDVVRDLAEMRRQVEREVSARATQLGPLAVTRDGELVVARYMANEPSGSRQAAALFMARPGLVLTFYLEIDSSRADVEALERPIFDSIVIQ